MMNSVLMNLRISTIVGVAVFLVMVYGSPVDTKPPPLLLPEIRSAIRNYGARQRPPSGNPTPPANYLTQAQGASLAWANTSSTANSSVTSDGNTTPAAIPAYLPPMAMTNLVNGASATGNSAGISSGGASAGHGLASASQIAMAEGTNVNTTLASQASNIGLGQVQGPCCRPAPECLVNSDCKINEVCINEKCIDRCEGICDSDKNAECRWVNQRQQPICVCKEGYVGNPRRCSCCI